MLFIATQKSMCPIYYAIQPKEAIHPKSAEFVLPTLAAAAVCAVSSAYDLGLWAAC